MTYRYSRIVGTGSILPPRVVTNQQLGAELGDQLLVGDDARGKNAPRADDAGITVRHEAVD